MTNISKLSPEAQKLIELGIGKRGYAESRKVDFTAVLGSHPELMSGLNEAVQYYGQEMINIARSEAAKPAGHGMRKVIKGLKVLKDSKK